MSTPVELAAHGRTLLQEAILAKLAEQPMTNAELAKALDLTSDHEGNDKDYLTWMILGDLLRAGKVSKNKTAGLGSKNELSLLWFPKVPFSSPRPEYRSVVV